MERTSMISSEDKEFQEDAKIAPKEDNSKGNQMHESTQGSLNMSVLNACRMVMYTLAFT